MSTTLNPVFHGSGATLMVLVGLTWLAMGWYIPYVVMNNLRATSENAARLRAARKRAKSAESVDLRAQWLAEQAASVQPVLDRDGVVWTEV